MHFSTVAVATLLTLAVRISAVPFPASPAVKAESDYIDGASNAKSDNANDIPNGVFSFKSAAAAQYYVPRDIPTVPFKVPESWAAMMPIDTRDKSKGKYFFWMYPAASQAGIDDVTIWLNGGPGCSSLEGLLQENGPYLFPWNITGQAPEPYVKPNPYSWHKLSTLIAVDQPVTTGFSVGKVIASNQKDIADAFYGFITNLYVAFPELKGKRLWLAGESYSGRFVSEIAFRLLQNGNPFNLQGIAINDPDFASGFFTEEAPSIQFAKRHKHHMRLSDAFLEKMDEEAAKHGLKDFMDKNLVYPPPDGGIHIPEEMEADPDYSPFNAITDEAAANNDDFNVYNVIQSVPIADPLGYPPSADDASAKNILNDIPGLKEMIHASNKAWLECTLKSPFVNGEDSSPPPAETVLPHVIETLQRTVINHGNRDWVLMANGSRLGIQNMTWAGMRGFQSGSNSPLVVDGQVAGNWHTERKLTFIEVYESGHMIPQDQPKAAYKTQQYLLGQVTSLS